MEEIILVFKQDVKVKDKDFVKVDYTQKIRGGGGLKKAMNALRAEISINFENVSKVYTFFISNKDIMAKCMYAQNKVLLPLDLESDSMVVRIEDISKGILGKISVYKLNRDYKTYTKVDLKYDLHNEKWDAKVDNKEVSKLMNYSKIKERLIKDYGVKIKKDSEIDLFKKQLRAAYIKYETKSVSEIAQDFGLTKLQYLELIGNVSKLKENESEMYRCYQRRVVRDYDNGMTEKEVIKEYNTSRDPLYRALKEQNHLITNKQLMEDVLVRSYAEHMTINEVNEFFKPIKRGFYTKEEFVNLIKTKGHPLKRKGILTPHKLEAVKLFRNGTPLGDLVNAARTNVGLEPLEDEYWRGYTRLLIGITEGRNGRIDFYDLHHNALLDRKIDESYE